MKSISKKGFTLIEILLVIAIIGILAAAVFAMIGNSDNSRRKAALSTARSILTYAQECYFNKQGLTAPTDPQTGGDLICIGSITTWPALSEGDCNYDVSDPSGYIYVVDCGEIGTITCNALNGGCVESVP